jgi:DNA-directed RNA polymerase specialized sigma24 family protein
MTEEDLSRHLETWRDWCRRPDLGLGYPSTATGIRYKAGDDFDSMVDWLDDRVALAVDASVDDLPPPERTAVRCTLLDGVKYWAYAERIEYVYERAREALKVALNKKGIE